MDANSPVPAASAVPPKSGSAKKWILFGCGGCLGLLALAGVFGAVIVTFVFGVMKNSDVYQTAYQRAQNSPEVQAALGTPIEDGFLVTGQVRTSSGAGTANLSFSISGPKGKAAVNANATKPPYGPWEYSAIKVTIIATGEVIDLTNAP